MVMMNKKMSAILLFFCTMAFVLSCGTEQESLENQNYEIESTELEENSLQVDAEDLEYPIATENGATFQRISPHEAKEMMESDEAVIILDVREQEEFEDGHIQGATLIPVGQIFDLAPIELPDKNVPVLVYCRSGRRSLEAAGKLVELGYSRVYEMGGILDWPYEVVR